MLPATPSDPGLALALTLVLALTGLQAQELPLETLLSEGRYEEARTALKVRTEEWAAEAGRDDSPATLLDWGRTLLSLGMVEDRLGDHDAAEHRLVEALKLIERGDGPDALRGDCLDALGLATSHNGHYDEAERYLLKAIALRGNAPEDTREPWLSASRDHLGLTYLEAGRYREAGILFHQSLEATAPDHAELLAQRLGYLARYYQTLHNDARARDLLEQALPHAEAVWGREHPNTLALLSQLGLTTSSLGDPARARAILEEVTTLAREQVSDTTSQLRLAGYLNILGSLHLLDGKTETARTLFLESLEAVEGSLGPDHLALAPLRNNLACTLQDLGEFAEAGIYLRQTRAAYLRHMGPAHQRSVEALVNLALNTLLQSGPAAAEGQISEASTAAGLVLDRLTRFGTERQRLNYLQNTDLLSLVCSAGQDPALIANTLLACKGRLLDVLLEEADRTPGPTLEQYRATQQKLDLLLLSAANPEPAQLDTLRTRLHALERQLSADHAATPTPSVPTWQDLQATLPVGGAYVDFARFTDHTAGREAHYGAILILPSGPPKWIPLAREEDLQTWLGTLARRLDYRTSQLQGNESPAPVLHLRPALHQLHQQFWAPIEAALPETTHTLCLCPDASLNFVSFAVLLDEQNRFLSNRYPLCAYVSSGRDLLLPARPARLDSARWEVFALDAFAEAPAPATTTPFQQSLSRTIAGLEPLAGARRERNLLKPFLAADSIIHTGSGADEATLRAIPPSPAVLHLITHGFFLGNGDSRSTDHRLQDFDDNPLPFYRSGLVLYGAKKSIAAPVTPDPGRDDILFATDVSTLPLHGTELVTLSSCQSALGESLAGEGVLGLRRGFAAAGARHLLLTLWPVADATTPDYMRRFYELARETGHLSQAAWQAQREGLAIVDPNNESELELAVLTMGPFVLCQRQGLLPMQDFSPPSPSKSNRALLLTVAALVVLTTLFYLRRRKKRPPTRSRLPS